MPSRLEHVVAANAVQLRRNRGWTQLDLARAMAEVGMGWTPGRAQQIESFAGTLSLPEALGLCWALKVPLADLLAGDDQIALPGPGRSVELRAFREALAGRGAIRQPDRGADEAADYEEVRAKATQLQLSPEVFIELCLQRFGRSFRAERDHRAGDLANLRPRSAQVKRGHAGRAVLADLRERLAAIGGPAQASLAVYQAAADQLEAELDALEQRTTQAAAQPAQDPATARELVTESTRLHAALDRLRGARYLHDNPDLLDHIDRLRTRLGQTQIYITTAYGLHLRTHLGDGAQL
ncbi:MAG: helix-turn-helix domain-containing protein [Acidothermaceae bacterium]